MKKINLTEALIGAALTLLVGFTGWTAYNTHQTMVHIASYETGNQKDHESYEEALSELKEFDKETKKCSENHEGRIIRLEAIQTKEDDEEDS